MDIFFDEVRGMDWEELRTLLIFAIHSSTARWGSPVAPHTPRHALIWKNCAFGTFNLFQFFGNFSFTQAWLPPISDTLLCHHHRCVIAKKPFIPFGVWHLSFPIKYTFFPIKHFLSFLIWQLQKSYVEEIVLILF